MLKLGGTHAVAQTEDAGLTHVPLYLVCFAHGFVIHVAGELRVHVTPFTEGLHKVILPSEVGHKPCFDLAGVTRHNHVSVGGSQCFTQRTPSR